MSMPGRFKGEPITHENQPVDLAGSALRSRCFDALETVVDPCSVAAGHPAGLCTMGLVIDLQLAAEGERHRARVTLGLTEPTCLMGHAFVPRIRDALRAVPGIAAVEVALDPHFVWSEERLSPDYRRGVQARRMAAPNGATPVRPLRFQHNASTKPASTP